MLSSGLLGDNPSDLEIYSIIGKIAKSAIFGRIAQSAIWANYKKRDGRIAKSAIFGPIAKSTIFAQLQNARYFPHNKIVVIIISNPSNDYHLRMGMLHICPTLLHGEICWLGKKEKTSYISARLAEIS